jgi:DNA-binding transcriptional ArsR family regulator
MIFYRLVEYKMSVAHELRLDRVYGAIADPTRRAILGVLAAGDANVGGLARRFPISFNGVSKHVKVLERAGLVERTVSGREHRLRLKAAPLGDATRWLEHYRAFWGARLDALEAFLVGQRRSPSAPPARCPADARASTAKRARRAGRPRR